MVFEIERKKGEWLDENFPHGAKEGEGFGRHKLPDGKLMMPAAPKESSRARLIMAQWAIGDWLVDGKSHYGDGLYERAADVLGVEKRTLENMKQIAETFTFTYRYVNVSHTHHYAVANIKKPVKDKKGRMSWGEEHDMGKAQEIFIRIIRFVLSAEQITFTLRSVNIVT